MRHDGEPRLLPLEGAKGGLAIAKGIFGRYFHLPGCTFLLIPDPRFGLCFRIHISGGIGCFSATVDEAVDEFKLFIHVQRLMEAPDIVTSGPSL